MPPRPLIDLDRLNPEHTVFDKEVVRAKNPQRFEMEMLDRIIFYEPEENLIAGVKDIAGDEFWVRGHFPERPILPGVLMVEAAGQLCSFYFVSVSKQRAVLGFAAADALKFRGLVSPGDQLILVGRMESQRSRRANFSAQGYVNQSLVFEANITGMVL